MLPKGYGSLNLHLISPNWSSEIPIHNTSCTNKLGLIMSVKVMSVAIFVAMRTVSFWKFIILITITAKQVIAMIT